MVAESQCRAPLLPHQIHWHCLSAQGREIVAGFGWSSSYSELCSTKPRSHPSSFSHDVRCVSAHYLDVSFVQFRSADKTSRNVTVRFSPPQAEHRGGHPSGAAERRVYRCTDANHRSPGGRHQGRGDEEGRGRRPRRRHGRNVLRPASSFDQINASCSEFARGSAAHPRGHLLS